MNINKEESKKLSDLYQIANDYDDGQAWHKVDKYFEQLGSKYNFDPTTHIITSKGIVERVSLCNKCGEIANYSDGVEKEKVKVGIKWEDMPICVNCLSKFHPERYREL